MDGHAGAVLAPGTGKTKTGRLWTYVRDERRIRASERRRRCSSPRLIVRASIRLAIYPDALWRMLERLRRWLHLWRLSGEPSMQKARCSIVLCNRAAINAPPCD